MAHEKIVRSMDIGFGNTKELTGYDGDGAPYFFSFPSIAPKASKQSISDSFGAARDTVVVNVKGVDYEVGPDALDLVDSVESRILHDRYVFSDQYLALYLGGLYYMDTEVIDYLQLGLPFNMMSYASNVKEFAIGEFKVGGRKIVVKDVGVVEQPLGGYEYHRSTAEDGADMDGETVLIIDPGYYTFDWVVVRDGRLIEPRSGAVPGGVSRVYSMIASAVSEEYLNGREFTNIEGVDKALRNGKQLRIRGKKYKLEPLLHKAVPAIDGPINQMVNRVKDMEDIDRIVLLSGGAKVFQKRLSEIIHDFEIEVPAAGIFANVWGYQEKALKDLGLR